MLSTEQERAVAKLHAQAAQWEEYEDEYDDSFDDLAGFDADANADTESEEPSPFGSPAFPDARLLCLMDKLKAAM